MPDNFRRYVSGVVCHPMVNERRTWSSIPPISNDSWLSDVLSMELWQRFLVKSPTRSSSWDERSETILHFIRLVGSNNIMNWFDYQICENDYIHGMTQSYLLDTLEFILTGQRRVAALSWASLIDYEPVKKHGKAEFSTSVFQKHAKNKTPYYDLSSVNLLVQWLSHPGGYSDLSNFMRIVFSKPSANSVISH